MDSLDWQGKLSRFLLGEVKILTMNTEIHLEVSSRDDLPSTVWQGTDVKDLKGVKRWDLSCNQLTDDAFYYLIQQTRHIQSDTITEINLSYNYLTVEIIAELYGWLDNFPNAHVDLRHNCFERKDISSKFLLDRITIQGEVERNISLLDKKIEQHTHLTREKIENFTVDNMAKVLEENMITFIQDYLTELQLPYQYIVNRDPQHKPVRELCAVFVRQGKFQREIKHEYDGLFYLPKSDTLVCNASQLHLTKRKLDKIIKSLNSLCIVMIPSWRQNVECDLMCHCPKGLESVMTQNTIPRVSLMVTYFTIEEGLDVRKEMSSNETVDIEFVQLCLLSMKDNYSVLKEALDHLI